MKRAIILGAAVLSMSIPVIAFGAETENDSYPSYEQTASAWLDQEGEEVKVTVDLTGGWSVEFAHGAVYLYDGKADINNEAVAIGLTLDEKTFRDYADKAPEENTYREFARSFAYADDAGTDYYFYTVGPDAYFMIQVAPEADGDIVSSRFSVEASDYVEDTEAE